MQSLTIDVRDFPEFSGIAYGSKTVTVTPALGVDLDGAYWSEGSRSSYAGFSAAFAPVPLPRHGGAPGFGGVSAEVLLAPVDSGASPAFVADYSIFRGKHMPPRIYTHPSRFAVLERRVNERHPRPILSGPQYTALEVAAHLIARARLPEFERTYHASLYQPARDALAALGLLTRTGAITAAGRNALRK